jgi:hypothetical protein
MAVQETSIKLAQADREAAAEDRREAADRIARLENAMVKMTPAISNRRLHPTESIYKSLKFRTAPRSKGLFRKWNRF